MSPEMRAKCEEAIFDRLDRGLSVNGWDVAYHAKVGQTSVLRVLRELIAADRLARSGEGRATRYRRASSPPKEGDAT